MNTETYLELKELFDQSIGDYLSFDTTTNITTTNAIVSTSLKAYDDGSDGHYDGMWVSIDEGNNIGVERKTGLPGTTTYATSTGTLTVLGAALSAETGAVSCRIHRYEPALKGRAINEALKEVYHDLNLTVDDMTLVTGNIIPDGHFESWSSTSALNWFTASNITLAQTSTAGCTRGGTYSAKLTASADSGYIYLNSNTYSRLLMLQDKTVNFYAMAYPQTANDAKIEIYTKDISGDTQTLTSTTTSQAGEFTQIKLEDQKLNDDLTDVEIRFYVNTSGQYVYYDDAYLGCHSLTEYLLPDDFVGGDLTKVVIQTTGHMDEMFYDLQPFIDDNGIELPFDIINNGTNLYLSLIEYLPIERRLRLIGRKPFNVLSSNTDTLTIDVHRIPLLIAKARMIFFGRMAVPVSKGDIDRFEYEYSKAQRDYLRLCSKKMPHESVKIRGESF